MRAHGGRASSCTSARRGHDTARPPICQGHFAAPKRIVAAIRLECAGSRTKPRSPLAYCGRPGTDAHARPAQSRCARDRSRARPKVTRIRARASSRPRKIPSHRGTRPRRYTRHDAQIAAPTLQKFRDRKTSRKRVENARAARQCLNHGPQLVPPSQLVSHKWQWWRLQVKP